MPIISNALAAMQQSAQSPALKRKIERLVHRGGIEEHLWCSTLSQIRQLSVPGPKMVAARHYDQEAMEHTVTHRESGSDLVHFAEGLFSTDLQSGFNGSAEAVSSEVLPSTVEIHYDALEHVMPSTETFAEARFIGGRRTHFSGGADGPITFGSGFFT